MDNTIKFAIIGYGRIGKRHAEMVKQNKQSELVAIADIDESLEEEVKENFSVPFYNSIEALLEAYPDIDVVNICTPNGLHAEQALMALSAQHHVVCEKPMALAKADCEAVISKALHESRHVFSVMQNRYSPPSVWLKSVMDQQLLGRIYQVQVNCYWNREEEYYTGSTWKGSLEMDGGPLYTQFSHFIDTMFWLFGDIKDIKARFGKFKEIEGNEFEDTGFIDFEFVDGGVGSFSYSTIIHDKNFESSITIIGENGTIKVGGQYMEKIEYCHVKDYEQPVLQPSNPPNNYGDYKGSAANHMYVIQNVVETINGDSKVTTNALEGLKVVDIIERMYEQRDLESLQTALKNSQSDLLV
ncbi:MAG: Gfo/Idh/MocA family oxidoreductase [Bacteroidetes bacterium]|nr:Gfo/Idh/MocA family oxidoreductase [Bacteroidota bacterium]